ncbi:hypothetical protein [Pseudaquabacterium terrae]|uniref:hypothetical protein n=1 Tax=Pseudaquabacterium terrae TaxID=2732868 RepID=UPI001C276B0F|nr:hypothetical protein [Aquabacterium terrae]
MANPEQVARQEIDRLLQAAGWAVQDVDGRTCGLIEAKRRGATLSATRAAPDNTTADLFDGPT